MTRIIVVSVVRRRIIAGFARGSNVRIRELGDIDVVQRHRSHVADQVIHEDEVGGIGLGEGIGALQDFDLQRKMAVRVRGSDRIQRDIVLHRRVEFLRAAITIP